MLESKVDEQNRLLKPNKIRSKMSNVNEKTSHRQKSTRKFRNWKLNNFRNWGYPSVSWSFIDFTSLRGGIPIRRRVSSYKRTAISPVHQKNFVARPGKTFIARPVFLQCFSLTIIARPKNTKKYRPSCPAPKLVARPFIGGGVKLWSMDPNSHQNCKILTFFLPRKKTNLLIKVDEILFLKTYCGSLKEIKIDGECELTFVGCHTWNVGKFREQRNIYILMNLKWVIIVLSLRWEKMARLETLVWSRPTVSWWLHLKCLISLRRIIFVRFLVTHHSSRILKISNYFFLHVIEKKINKNNIFYH